MKRILKLLGMAAAAGALHSVATAAPDVLPPAYGGFVAAVLATVTAYLMKPPKK